MSKYKIKVNVELIECDESEPNNVPTKQKDGSFTMTINEQDAISIDKCESSVLQTAYPMIRVVPTKQCGSIISIS
jgi:hypothetical protein